MRLLSTSTLQFFECFEEDAPSYCALSHRWDTEEVDYKAILRGATRKDSDGYRKVWGACRVAHELGYHWIWIDSCCIDRSSSGELTEAINSMFSWYQKAAVCIVYLQDVHEERFSQSSPENGLHNVADASKILHNSEGLPSSWFTRGWTLQELLAPMHVRFYNTRFHFLGTKEDLVESLAAITGIDREYLLHQRDVEEASIATRMSWAAYRSTTRVEDTAYCLMGIFSIHMALLYGEGRHAFFRLQLEIIAKSDDESIFAWLPNPDARPNEVYGMLAASPADFSVSSRMRRTDTAVARSLPYQFTNKGLELSRAPRGSSYNPSIGTEVLVPLACVNDAGAGGQVVAVVLREVGDAWYRVKCDKIHYCRSKLDFQTLSWINPPVQFCVLQADLRQRGVRKARTVEDLSAAGDHSKYRKRRGFEVVILLFFYALGLVMISWDGSLRMPNVSIGSFVWIAARSVLQILATYFTWVQCMMIYNNGWLNRTIHASLQWYPFILIVLITATNVIWTL